MAEVEFPDDSRIHPPGSPLRIVLSNFSAVEKKLELAFQLQSYQGHTAEKGKQSVSIAPGQRLIHTLIPKLAPGIYSLAMAGLDGRTLDELIQVVDATRLFGEQPTEFLQQMPEIRKTLGRTVKETYLDWDNTEPVPGLFHYHWFETVLKKESAEGAYEVRPVVGFCTDWAGPEVRERVQDGTYVRYMANHLQVPHRMTDWSRFVRQMARRYKGRFSHWVFWENPDQLDSPQSVPPGTYPKMLRILKKWVTTYDPKAKIVAGGFNIDKTLDYLERIENPAELAFDRIAVRMNIGELSPEEADIGGFLDELNELLKLKETGRVVETAELDWGIGEFVTPLEQAAFHARACLILNSRGAEPHRFPFKNVAFSFEGHGVFYKTRYGSTENLQDYKPVFIPKPAYFALVHCEEFLKKWTFVLRATLPDNDLQANRAFVYRNAAGELTAALWRAQRTARDYEAPTSWKGATARDAFGFPVNLADGLRCSALPMFIGLSKGHSIGQLSDELRTLRPKDGKNLVVLDLQLDESDSCTRAKYWVKGAKGTLEKLGSLPGEGKRKVKFATGISTEGFEFALTVAGDVVLSRRWWFEGNGQKLWLKLNGAEEQPWDLTKGKVGYPGMRESTFVLRGCPAGRNVVSLRYEKPGNCAGYRLEMLKERYASLSRWGVLNAAQTRGELQKFKSASGTPLKIGKTRYGSGLGTHAVSFLEFPLDGQFTSFEVTVGIDNITDGRGSAIFEIHVDGEEKASSGVMNGFSPAKALKLENLETARRMFLIVKDAGDGNKDDLANWVDGKLYLK